MSVAIEGPGATAKAEGLSAWFIRRPVASILAAVAVTLLGIVSIPNLPVAPLPEADFPTLQVTATLPGASPETMASSVATVLETAFTGIAGVTEMTSASSLGLTSITLQFLLERDIDVAAQDVQAAINSVAGRLPDNLPSLPTWRKVNPTDGPVMAMTVTSSTLPTTELSDIVETRLARRLSQIDGVAQVMVNGLQRPSIRIQAQPERLAAYGLTLENIRAAIASANVNRPKGAIYGGASISTLETNDQLFSDSDYRDVVVATRDGALIRVGDVARVEVGPEDAYVSARPDGVPGLGIFVDRQPGANIIAIADAIRERLPALMADLPADINVTVMNDRTRTIRASLHEVEITLVLTLGLVVLVMGLFLRQVAATLIVGVVLAISVIATFGVIYLLGFSLNNLSLVALIIAIGFVVDDAIVVVENIHRHMEAGESRIAAALAGSKEVGFTVVSITLSLIAAFIPLLFMGGIVGRLFREFSLTVHLPCDRSDRHIEGMRWSLLQEARKPSMHDSIRRHLPIPGTFNIRDLGGYATGSGETRWRRILRGDGLHHHDAAGIDALTDEGVTTIIDLRHGNELEIRRNPFRVHPTVAYHNVSLFDRLAPEDFSASDVLLDLYLQALATRHSALAEVLTLIAGAPQGIVLFHCTVGKDRTGLVAALLLALAGVPVPTILADYALTKSMIAPLLERLLTEAEARGADVATLRRLMACEPRTMAATIAHLIDGHGSVEGYLLSIGLSNATLARLRARLMEDP